MKYLRKRVRKSMWKSVKKVVPTSLDLSLLYTSTFCEKNRILIHGNSKRFWRGQMVNVHHSDLSVVYETGFFKPKRKIYKKNVKSAIVNTILMRAAKMGGPRMLKDNGIHWSQGAPTAARPPFTNPGLRPHTPPVKHTPGGPGHPHLLQININ